MTQTIERPMSIQPFRIFGAVVSRVRRLSPSFLRVTFTGPDLGSFADNGYDQRIKLILPLPEIGMAEMPDGPDWYPRWRALPTERRNPIRTYTVRAVRPRAAEVDVDLVLHGDGGPAARWAIAARPGSIAALLGPDAGYPGVHGGLEFRPPAQTDRLLLAGDETAVPAISSILERLPAEARGEAVLEVPESGDDLAVSRAAGVRVTWLPRDGAEHGSRLVPGGTGGDRAAPRRRDRPGIRHRTGGRRHRRRHPLGGPGRHRRPAADRRRPSSTPGWPARRAWSRRCAGTWSASTGWTAGRWRSWATGDWAGPRRTDGRWAGAWVTRPAPAPTIRARAGAPVGSLTWGG